MKTLATLPTLTPNLSHWDYSLVGSLSPMAGWRGLSAILHSTELAVTVMSVNGARV